MGKSTAVLTDLAGATTTAFGATAKTAAINANGPIQDLDGMAVLAYRKAQELLTILNQMVLDNTGATTNAVVKAGDPNFTALDNVRQVLV